MFLLKPDTLILEYLLVQYCTLLCCISKKQTCSRLLASATQQKGATLHLWRIGPVVCCWLKSLDLRLWVGGNGRFIKPVRAVLGENPLWRRSSPFSRWDRFIFHILSDHWTCGVFVRLSDEWQRSHGENKQQAYCRWTSKSFGWITGIHYYVQKWSTVALLNKNNIIIITFSVRMLLLLMLCFLV